MTAFEVIGEECMPLARADRSDASGFRSPRPSMCWWKFPAAARSICARCSSTSWPAPWRAVWSAQAVLAESGAQAKSFWAIREGLVEGQARRGYHVRTDLAVPLSGVAALVDHGARADRLALSRLDCARLRPCRRRQHPFQRVAAEPVAEAERARHGRGNRERRSTDLVAALGGSISAEHGIGRSRSARLLVGAVARPSAAAQRA